MLKIASEEVSDKLAESIKRMNSRQTDNLVNKTFLALSKDMRI